MRRNARVLITIVIITAICGTILGVQKVSLNNLERGSDDLLGLTLGLDLQGGSHLIYQAINPETGVPGGVTEDQMQSLSRTIERRVNASGLGEPIIQILGEDRLLIQLPGIRDPGRAKALIGETARLEFKHRTTDVPPKAVENITDDDIVSVKAEEVQSDGTFVTEEERNSEVSSDPIETAEALVVEFTAEGFEKFSKVFQTLITSANLSMSMAQTGTLIPPARLGINIEGLEQLRYNTLGLNMYPVWTEMQGESEVVVNKFIIALPSSDDGSKGAISVEDANAKIGNNTRIQSHSFICEKVTIGKKCFISHGVMFTNDLMKSGKIERNSKLLKKTRIGNSVIIGSNSTILPVNISNNIVVGAGSVVTQDLKIKGIYAGNPAKLIRRL